MKYDKQLGLFQVTTERVTVRTEPGSYFIGSLFKGDYFYAEHVHVGHDKHTHKPTHRWVWGYGGGSYKGFGWVNFGKHYPMAIIDEVNKSNEFEEKIKIYLKNNFRNKTIQQIATNHGLGFPPDKSNSATGNIHLAHSSTPLYLNQTNGIGRDHGRKGTNLASHVNKGQRLSWRYFAKDEKLHCVDFHPTGEPVKYHGKWGFIKNDAIASIRIKHKGSHSTLWVLKNNKWVIKT